MIKLKELLDEKADYYNNPSFVIDDPISIPVSYTHLDVYKRQICDLIPLNQ